MSFPDISTLLPQIFPFLPQVDGGVISAPRAGWVHITFTTAFKSTPAFAAIQASASFVKAAQTLPSPSKIPYPSIPAVNLSALKITAPSKPQTWGQTVRQLVDGNCSNTIGKVPIIGGYICEGIDVTFGALFEIIADGIQDLYYIFDQPALINAIIPAVESKVASDWNDGLAKIQNALNSGIIDPVNSAFAQFVGPIQNAINQVMTLLLQQLNLPPGVAVPVLQYRNLTTTGVDVYLPGANTSVSWLAIVKASQSTSALPGPISTAAPGTSGVTGIPLIPFPTFGG